MGGGCQHGSIDPGGAVQCLGGLIERLKLFVLLHLGPIGSIPQVQGDWRHCPHVADGSIHMTVMTTRPTMEFIRDVTTPNFNAERCSDRSMSPPRKKDG